MQNFYNALNTGLQLGQQARANQERREGRNALSAFITDPNEQTAGALAPYNPELAYKFGQDQRAAKAAQAEGDLTAAALSTDPNVRGPALQQLARMNFGKFQALDERQQKALTEESEMFGGIALNLSQIPYAQRRDLILGYAQQMPQFSDEINEIAYLPENEQNTALQVAITEAGLVQEMIKLRQPQQFNVAPGEGRYERDPVTGQISTVIQPNYGGAPAFSPVQGGAQPNAKTINGVTYYQNPSTGQWFDNPQEAMGAR